MGLRSAYCQHGLVCSMWVSRCFWKNLYISFGLYLTLWLLGLKETPAPREAHTYPESGVLLVVAGEVKDAFSGHGQPCVLGQS